MSGDDATADYESDVRAARRNGTKNDNIARFIALREINMTPDEYHYVYYYYKLCNARDYVLVGKSEHPRVCGSQRPIVGVFELTRRILYKTMCVHMYVRHRFSTSVSLVYI